MTPNFLQQLELCCAGQRGDIFAIDQNLPAGRLVKTDHVFEQSALAASGAAEDGKYFAGIDFEVNVVEHDLAVVGRGEVLDADNRFAGSPGFAFTLSDNNRPPKKYRR